MDWDFFVSHASEDSAIIARPLARYLMAVGYRVWFDEFELNVGDSLRARIDEGLARSAFGIVILSPSFFAKKWPKAELDGLFARDTYDKPRLLPVWHQLTAAEVAAQSPLLAARLAASGGDVRGIGQTIVQAATHSGLPLPSAALESLLDAAETSQVVDFFLLNPSVVARAVTTRRLLMRPAIAGWAGLAPDFLFSVFQPSARVIDIHAMLLGPVSTDETEHLSTLFSTAEAFTRFAENGGFSRANRRRCPSSDWSWSPGVVEVTIVAGRRKDSPSLHSKWLASGIDGVELRTYDWLKDAATDADVNGAYFRNIEVTGPNVNVELTALL